MSTFGWKHALWLGLLIPCTIDLGWKIPVGQYDLRVNYIVTLVALISILATNRSILVEYLRSRVFLSFGVFALAGLVSTFAVSHNTSRSVAIWLWSAGTILSMPLLFRYLSSINEKRFLDFSLAIYSLGLSLMVFVDAFLCFASTGKSSIGAVIFSRNGDMLTGVCRPHAFFQEPNYYAAFTLLVCAWARIRLFHETGRAQWLIGAAYVMGIVAMLASTSRLGWLAVAVLGALEVFFLLKRGIRRIQLKSVLIGAAGFAILGGIAVQSSWLESTLFFKGRALLEGRADKGMLERFENFDASISVFAKSPLVGAGPGAAGAYLIEVLPNHPWLESQPKKTIDQLHSLPMSYSLWGEILSEWGFLGLLGILAGIFYWYRPGFQWENCLWVILPILLVTITWQSIARFDLWLVMGMISLRMKQRLS